MKQIEQVKSSPEVLISEIKGREEIDIRTEIEKLKEELREIENITLTESHKKRGNYWSAIYRDDKLYYENYIYKVQLGFEYPFLLSLPQGGRIEYIRNSLLFFIAGLEHGINITRNSAVDYLNGLYVTKEIEEIEERVEEVVEENKEKEKKPAKRRKRKDDNGSSGV